MKLFFILLMITSVILCCCVNGSDGSGLDQGFDSLDTLTQEIETIQELEEDMNEPLITKDELLKYIQENQNKETVDITVEDLEGIDIEDFIEFWHLTKDNIKDSFLKIIVDRYKEHLIWEENAKIFAREIVNVDSTEEEFQEFIKIFLSAIDKKIVYSDKMDGFIWLDINNEKETTLYIAQTKNINELSIGFLTPSASTLLEAVIGNGPEGAGMLGNLVYNKNEKYMLFAHPYEGPLFEYAKVFHVLEG
jgi:hypothetical protein